MNQREGRGNTRRLRATFIEGARMAAAIAMHPPACGQPGKIGMQMLNHMKAYEQTVDWGKFLFDAETLLTKLGAKYYIKNDLRSFGVDQ